MAKFLTTFSDYPQRLKAASRSLGSCRLLVSRFLSTAMPKMLRLLLTRSDVHARRSLRRSGNDDARPQHRSAQHNRPGYKTISAVDLLMNAPFEE